MNKLIAFLSILSVITILIGVESDSLKVKAIESFKSENYPLAIQQIQEAIRLNDKDPELYYYLGFFMHYRANDSRPLLGYDTSWSEEIFKNLEKAIKLKPDFGDAKYFYGAECSAKAFDAMYHRDLKQLKKVYGNAYDIGAYPDWLLEFGRNILNSCPRDAILFTGGNADFDVCSYLQLWEKVRTDVSVIPLSELERPWFIEYVKKGLKGALKPVYVNLTDRQIWDAHPYKWKETQIEIPVPDSMIHSGQTNEYVMKFNLKPDLKSNRYNIKIEGDKQEERTLLSVQRAMLLRIVEDNFKFRNICFTNCCDITLMGGLDEYLQNEGMISHLLANKPSEDNKANVRAIEKLLIKENFQSFKTVKDHDIPRISNITSLYLSALVISFSDSVARKDKQAAQRWVDFYKENLMPDLDKETEMYYLNMLQNVVNSME